MSTKPAVTILKSDVSPQRAPSSLSRWRSGNAKRAGRFVRHTLALNDKVSRSIQPVTLPGLRVLLGVLFVWFGALKVAGASPVEAIVAGTLPWLDPELLVPGLGAVELLLGIGLVCGVAMWLVLPVVLVHLTGTFLAFAMLPELMFRAGNPLLLSESGEFVAKNFVLIAATLVLMSHTRPGAAAAVNIDAIERSRAA